MGDKTLLKKSCPWLNINHQGSKQVLSQADQKLGNLLIIRKVTFNIAQYQNLSKI